MFTIRQDLNNMKFGLWTVLKEDINRTGKDIRWICRCECGTEKSILGKYLINGKSISCGCIKKQDLAGKRIGSLTIKETLYNYNGYNKATYRCLCDCGNEIYVKSSSIYKTKSCGCSRKKNYSGNKYGKLKVLETLYTPNKPTMCKCLCDCGNIITTKANSLVGGNTTSCGCIHSPSLIGLIFNRLVVLDEYYKDNHKYCWCKCICGQELEVLGYSLTSGNTSSCGCYRSEKYSKREIFIAEYLDNANIPYIPQYTFSDCIGVGNKKLRFDFYFPTHNTILEYDGKQHYEPIDYFGGENSFVIQQRNDSIKNDYCNNHNINLIRIPYTYTDYQITEILNQIIHSKPVTTTAA